MMRTTTVIVLALACCSSSGGIFPQPEAGSPDGQPHDRSAPESAPTDHSAPDSAPPRLPDAGPGDIGALFDDAGCLKIVPVKAADPWTMRAPSAGFGGIVTQQQTGSHTDVFLKSPTDYTRIGARLDWGGTVVFFGWSSNPQSNVIDANDTGRELQIALYDPMRARQPCAHDASCLAAPPSCEPSITFLGWNPVQGGDECGHGAPVLFHGRAGDALRLQIRPIQWNPDWNATDCRKSPCPCCSTRAAARCR